ncbi:TIM barrel protein [Curtobacterium sp. 24E2]
MPTTSVQLYSLRDAIAEDLDKAIARVAEIGYENVEPYAFVERAADLERAFAATGLKAPSGHVAVIDAEDTAPIWDAAERLGIQTVIDPFIPTDRWQTADDVAKIAERVNVLTAEAASRGLKFGYHNHQWEFTNKVDGRTVYDHFVSQISPETVLELDTFWATVGGADAPPCCGHSATASSPSTSRTARSTATSSPRCPRRRARSSCPRRCSVRSRTRPPRARATWTWRASSPRRRRPSASSSSTPTRATSSRASPSPSHG